MEKKKTMETDFKNQKYQENITDENYNVKTDIIIR